MFRKQMSATKYKVLKSFVFRGVQYEPGGTFDPVAAQCVPHKLGNLLRQRILGDLGPSLTEAPNAGKADVFDDKQPRRRRQS